MARTRRFAPLIGIAKGSITFDWVRGVRITAFRIGLNCHARYDCRDLPVLASRDRRLAQSVGYLCSLGRGERICHLLSLAKQKIDSIGFSIWLRIGVEDLFNRDRFYRHVLR